ncbi:WecB/TagA/CpsF family glycosyltransferase [soil metagenome]
MAAQAGAVGDSGSKVVTRIRLLGSPLDIAPQAAILAAIDRRLAGSTAHCLHIATSNPEYVMQARSNPEFLAALDRADFVTCDGIGTLLAAKILASGEGAERLSGTDLTTYFAERSGFEQDGGFFLLGGMDAVAASISLQQAYPSARIAGAWSGGSAEPEHDAESIRRIVVGGADVVLVAYGAPGQVMWIDRNIDGLSKAGVRVSIGVGGVLDYWSGHAERAPENWRRSGLEWLYRLLREPWRWRRQLVLPKFACLVGWSAIFQHGRFLKTRVTGRAA